MSRKTREIKKNFKVFCEGDTEFNYIDEMKRQKKLSIAIKNINMRGGGYSNFLEQVKIDGAANCLAKFIIIDGDRAVAEEGEKKKLRELLEYCILQNNSGRIPHFLIINYPDFEYIACLHTPKYRSQNVVQYIIRELGYKDIDEFKADKKIYTVLNTCGNSSELMCSRLRKDDCFICNDYKLKKGMYEIQIATNYDWDKLGRKSSNINEFFEIINEF